MFGIRKAKNLLFLLFIPYIIWSFLGGHKQKILEINTDHLSILTASIGSFIALIKLKKIRKIELEVAIYIFSIILIFILSIFLSPHRTASILRLRDHIIYYFITFSAAIYFKDKESMFFRSILFSTVLSSTVVLTAWLFLGLGSWRRVTIPVFDFSTGVFSYFPKGYESSSDPNVLAFFIYLGALTILYVKGLRGIWRFCFILCIFSGILTFSKSAFLAFFGSVLFYLGLNKSLFIFIGFQKKYRRINKSYLWTAFFLFMFSLISLFFANLWFPIVEERFSNSAYFSDRIERLGYVFNKVLESPFILVIGQGIGASRFDVDPHNFYLSTIYDSGLLSLLSILTFFVYIIYRIYQLNGFNKTFAFAVSLVVYLFIAALFYWQVRSYYFVLLILLFFIFSGHQKRQYHF